MASYTKLKDGSWGIRGSLPAPVAGEVVTVAKKSGEIKQETVGRVLWTGTDYQGRQSYLASIATASGSRKQSGGCDCDCDDCSRRCQCEAHCNCRGGNVYDC